MGWYASGTASVELILWPVWRLQSSTVFLFLTFHRERERREQVKEKCRQVNSHPMIMAKSFKHNRARLWKSITVAIRKAI